ncbi:hypothetical protein K469DRAFT_755127 [Zopfia rhizophila CBS 207.26]|uniref:Prion-inhibition and propagation HeLo domain-containing protein n=1 Tax=Zopfia rhizophila CBS 207.26 TaxID=1314779 RepID=A0A6A6DGC1_9PEZI|nr:hypothetical protein K469DRAFT_755127 [Zopfia rhizophila CBS 207.26]
MEVDDPVRAASTAIAALQEGYQAYRNHKLTESFGTDFRSFQRRFEAQMVLLRWESYRLRQATVLGMTKSSMSEQSWIIQICSLLVDVKCKVDTCQALAKKYAENAKERPVKKHVESIEEKVELRPEPRLVTPLRKEGGKQSNASPNMSKIRRSLKNFTSKIPSRSELTSKNLKQDAVLKEKSKSDPQENKRNAPETKKEKDHLQSSQGSAGIVYHSLWEANDRNTFENNLHQITSVVQQLRGYIHLYVARESDGKRSDPAAPGSALPRSPTFQAPTPLNYPIKSRWWKYPKPSSLSSATTGKRVRLQPLDRPIYQCQDAFHRLYLDLQTCLSGSGFRPSLSAKLYYDHSHTWKELRPYRGVSMRKHSMMFIFQAHLNPSLEGSLLIVAETPILEPVEREQLDHESEISKLLTQRYLKGDLLIDSVTIDSINLARDREFFVCLGSLMMRAPHGVFLPEDLLAPKESQENHPDAETEANTSGDNHSNSSIRPDATDPSAFRKSEDSSLDDQSSNQNQKSVNEPKKDSSNLPQDLINELRSPVVHHLYQDRTHLWIKQTSLSKLLEDNSFRHEDYTHTHLRLALLLSMNYVSLGFGGEACIFRPEDCLYYHRADERAAASHDDVVLSPFVRIRERKLTGVGASKGISSGKRQSLLELGLLLYQIGSWSHISYEHPRGFQALVRHSTSNLESCATHLGNRFTDIVLSCLTDRKYHDKFSVSIPTTEVHEWPRYGTKDQSHRLQASIEEARSKGRDLPRVGLKGKRPMNEVLEIMHYVIGPLQKLVDDLKALEDPDVVMTPTGSEGRSSTESFADHRSFLSTGNPFLERGEWTGNREIVGDAERNGGSEEYTESEEESEPRPRLVHRHTFVESVPESLDRESSSRPKHERNISRRQSPEDGIRVVGMDEEGPVIEAVD